MLLWQRVGRCNQSGFVVARFQAPGGRCEAIPRLLRQGGPSWRGQTVAAARAGLLRSGGRPHRPGAPLAAALSELARRDAVIRCKHLPDGSFL